MAMEGKDWLYLGGGLLGGAALGALLRKKDVRVQGPPYAPFLRRSYNWGGLDMEAQIGAVYDTDERNLTPGYQVRFVGEDLYGEKGLTSDFLLMRFETPEEAMDAADGSMTEEGKASPTSEWQLTDEMKKRVSQEEPAGVWVDSELEGTRKRKKKRGWY